MLLLLGGATSRLIDLFVCPHAIDEEEDMSNLALPEQVMVWKIGGKPGNGGADIGWTSSPSFWDRFGSVALKVAKGALKKALLCAVKNRLNYEKRDSGGWAFTVSVRLWPSSDGLNH
jgi:hypothetical protein